MNKPIITQEEVKKLLDYNPETGNLIWKRRDCAPASWNTKFAGKIAGSMTLANGYMKIGINNISYLQHRIIWVWVYGYLPEKEVDHINRVRHDNRLINLREANPAQNRQNRSKSSNNTSGITGVIYAKHHGKYHARIKVNGKSNHLGCFFTREEAIKARREAEGKYFGKFRNQGVK
jgi:hypothetical protein